MQLSNPITDCGLLYTLEFASYQTLVHNDYITGLSSLSNRESLNILGALIYAYQGKTYK